VTTDDFVDPGEPGELTAYMKAKDLLNLALVIRPNEVRHDGDGKDDNGNPKAYTYVNCDVWVIDGSGIVDSGTGVQFSWARVLPQLSDRIGQFVAAKPVILGDNSRVLQPLSDTGKAMARKVIAEIKAGGAALNEEPPADLSDGGEPY
jgi:hypothetical protein